MRNALLVLLFITFQAASIAAAQSTPTVEIALSQVTARQGDVVTAEVWVRNATYVGGLDIGITVDEACLRILDRQPGGFLPTTDAEGAFSAFSEVNEHDTRLASALADRTKHASGDGVFYRVQLEVTCAQGIADLNVARAQVSSYIDPNAEIIDLINYELDRGTLNVVNAQLVIATEGQVAPEGQVTVAPTVTTELVPTLTPETQVTAVPTATTELVPTATIEPAPTLTLETAPAEDTGTPQNNLMVIVLVCLTVAVVVLLVIGLRILRIGRKDEE